MSYTTETDSGYQIKIPLKFRGYEIKKPCGKGKFASVVKVKDTNSHKVYAAKIIPEKGLKNQETARKMINNEIEILQKANHPNVVQLYEIIKLTTKLDTFIILIEEYCPNGSLYDYTLANGLKNEHERIRVLRGITEGLSHLHSLGIAHCDIKPDNILIGEGMNPKICDFNLSKIVKKADDSERGGSKAFAAPEIFKFEAIDFLRADIWSLGIMIFSIIADKYPYNNVEDAHKGILILESKDKKMVAFVKRCLKVNPLKRATADELLNDPYLKYDDEEANKEDDDDDNDDDNVFLEKKKLESLKKSTKTSLNLTEKSAKMKTKMKKESMKKSMETDPKLFVANKMKKITKNEVILSDDGLPPLAEGNFEDDDELDDEIFEMIHGYRRSMLNLNESNESFTELTIYSRKNPDSKLNQSIEIQSNDNNNNSEQPQNDSNENGDDVEGSASFSVFLELGYDFELQNEIEGSILDGHADDDADDEEDENDDFGDYEIEKIENRICEKIVDFKYQKKKKPNKKGIHTKKKEKKNRKNEQDEE